MAHYLFVNEACAKQQYPVMHQSCTYTAVSTLTAWHGAMDRPNIREKQAQVLGI